MTLADDPTERLSAAADAVRDKTSGRAPTIGVVLGSGLGGFADTLEASQAIAYEDIPHMPTASVPGHAGKLWVGRRGDVTVAALQGRVHAYEGYSAEQVAFGVRLLAELGCHAVLLTNAAGGIGKDLAPGRLMLIVDHLNLTGQNPIVGYSDPFVDMSAAYDEGIANAAMRAAEIESMDLAEGIYAGVLGPSYETPAEIRMLRDAGADAVGMSTVIEVIALVHRGVRVGAVSCITNKAAGLFTGRLDHGDVQVEALRAAGSFQRFLARWVELCAKGDH